MPASDRSYLSPPNVLSLSTSSSASIFTSLSFFVCFTTIAWPRGCRRVWRVLLDRVWRDIDVAEVNTSTNMQELARRLQRSGRHLPERALSRHSDMSNRSARRWPCVPHFAPCAHCRIECGSPRAQIKAPRPAKLWSRHARLLNQILLCGRPLWSTIRETNARTAENFSRFHLVEFSIHSFVRCIYATWNEMAALLQWPALMQLSS